MVDKGKVWLRCMECGNKFSRSLSKSLYNVKCPKCKSYDVEVD